MQQPTPLPSRKGALSHEEMTSEAYQSPCSLNWACQPRPMHSRPFSRHLTPPGPVTQASSPVHQTELRVWSWPGVLVQLPIPRNPQFLFGQYALTSSDPAPWCMYHRLRQGPFTWHSCSWAQVPQAARSFIISHHPASRVAAPALDPL